MESTMYMLGVTYLTCLGQNRFRLFVSHIYLVLTA
jgi:hypothetical protein